MDRLINLYMKTLERAVQKDAEDHVRVIQASGLGWVIVRGRRLTEGEKRGNYRVSPVVGKNSGTVISRADPADFVLDQVVDNTYLGRMPVVSYQVGGTVIAVAANEPGSPEVLQLQEGYGQQMARPPSSIRPYAPAAGIVGSRRANVVSGSDGADTIGFSSDPRPASGFVNCGAGDGDTIVP